ncbi:MAG TPA: DedA family protein [Candidatus Kapabacteria bacterium]|jgi:membrane protein DedA with SNARE-associated domain|nr:DedA family protein [Candidatus Kapabacteria bacterium]HPU23450.1 DedA family protein [Candidatus Kapabacteria bacterium]
MLETLIEIIQKIPPFWILIIAFAVTYIENIFPPSPSDAALVFMGALVGTGTVGFIPLLLFATIGSTLGFITMFVLGVRFEMKFIETDKLKFVSKKALMKVDDLFKKWGYWLIVANRFLSGTRAVIAFFAGMSLLSFRKSTVLSFLSALLWNFILIYSGYIFGDNWKKVDEYMTLYGYILIPVVVVLIAAYFIYSFIQGKKQNANT